MALLGGEAVPADRLGVVLGDPLAFGVHDPEIGLSEGIALLGGEAVPADRLGVVLEDPLAVAIHDSEIVLSKGVTLLGVALESSKGCGKVTQLICRYRLVEGLRRHRKSAHCHEQHRDRSEKLSRLLYHFHGTRRLPHTLNLGILSGKHGESTVPLAGRTCASETEYT